MILENLSAVSGRTSDMKELFFLAAGIISRQIKQTIGVNICV
jgi:hypothetical protein